MLAQSSTSNFSFAVPLWKHRALLWQFTERNVELRHKGSHLGIMWAFLGPLLLLGLQVLVFGYIMNGRFGVIPNETKIDYGLGLFMGMSLFHFTAEVLTTAPALITANSNFVKKVVFPIEIIPAAAVGSAFIHVAISLCLVLLGVTFFGQGITLGVLWLPVILIPMVLAGLGAAWFIAAFAVFVRDIAQLLQFGTMALMFASAVFYPASSIPPAAWTFMRFNPLLLAIEIARDAVLWHRSPNLTHVFYLWLFGLAACAVGYAVFRKLRPAFADVL
jgi:lipopolysaccharide transport system permease protein